MLFAFVTLHVSGVTAKGVGQLLLLPRWETEDQRGVGEVGSPRRVGTQ